MAVDSEKPSEWLRTKVMSSITSPGFCVKSRQGTRRGTQDRVCAGVEVSITADSNDVNGAADRTEILRKLTGEPALAVVIAARRDEQQRKLALQRGVETALHPE